MQSKNASAIGQANPMDELIDKVTWREPLVRSEVVAAYLDVTVQTVRRWSRIPVDPLPVLRFGRRGFRRYRLSEISAWLERRKVE